MQDLKVAYTFQNGFNKEATSMYGWLQHYNLNPSWGQSDEAGVLVINLPDSEMDCLRMMQKANPARFGDAPPVDYFEPGWENNRIYKIAPLQIGGTITEKLVKGKMKYVAFNTATKQERSFKSLMNAMHVIEKHWEATARLWVRGVYTGPIPE